MDKELRYQILRALVRERRLLKAAAKDVQAESFPTREERIVAGAAIDFYNTYEEPIGALLRSAAEDKAQKLGVDTKQKLFELVGSIQSAALPQVPIQALIDRLASLKVASFYDQALDEILTAKEQDKLTQQTLVEIIERSKTVLSNGNIVMTDYLDDLEKRIARYASAEGRRCPLLFIPELDEKIDLIGRGEIAFWMAPPGGGKGLALVHTGTALARQGFNVLHITLEDPKILVEKRYDASLTGLPVNKLRQLPNKLRRRFRRIVEEMHGKIFIIDGAEGGWTVTKIEKAFEQACRDGFPPDAIIIDYDEYIVCEKAIKGESFRRFEFSEIYTRLKDLAAKLKIVLWTAAQTSKEGEGRKIITSKQTAEDFSKIRKAFMVITIGSDPEVENLKYLYVAKHREDKQKFGVEIKWDPYRALFYDAEATRLYKRLQKQRARHT